jgi:hypothetical protein
MRNRSDGAFGNAFKPAPLAKNGPLKLWRKTFGNE